MKTRWPGNELPKFNTPEHQEELDSFVGQLPEGMLKPDLGIDTKYLRETTVQVLKDMRRKVTLGHDYTKENILL